MREFISEYGAGIKSGRKDRAVTLNKKKKVIKTIIIVLVPAMMVSYILLILRITPQAKGISESLNEQDTSGELLLKSINMLPPVYEQIMSVFEKKYSSTLTLEVANSSNHEIYLGLEYYADSGNILFYSPGINSGTKILTVPANWTGELNYPITYRRFVFGGSIKIMIARCKEMEQERLFLPLDSEIILNKQYIIVSEKP